MIIHMYVYINSIWMGVARNILIAITFTFPMLSFLIFEFSKMQTGSLIPKCSLKCKAVNIRPTYLPGPMLKFTENKQNQLPGLRNTYSRGTPRNPSKQLAVNTDGCSSRLISGPSRHCARQLEAFRSLFLSHSNKCQVLEESP